MKRRRGSARGRALLPRDRRARRVLTRRLNGGRLRAALLAATALICSLCATMDVIQSRSRLLRALITAVAFTFETSATTLRWVGSGWVEVETAMLMTAVLMHARMKFTSSRIEMSTYGRIRSCNSACVSESNASKPPRRFGFPIDRLSEGARASIGEDIRHVPETLRINNSTEPLEGGHCAHRVQVERAEEQEVGRSASAAGPLMFSAISDNGGLWRV